MYTSVSYSEVEIIDLPGLEKFIDDAKRGNLPSYDEEDLYLFLDGIKIEDNELSFSGMDGWKIISYWYPMFVEFLRDIAVFVEGEVYLEFENHDEAGHISFHDGECVISAGLMEWHNYSPAEMRDNIPPLSADLESALVLRKLKPKEEK